MFVSGLAPIDEERNTIGETITDQTRAVYTKLETALAAHGATFSDLAKITIYLRNAEDIDEFNRVPGEFCRNIPADIITGNTYPANFPGITFCG